MVLRWGSLLADGVTWNGQIGILSKFGADIASSGLSQTYERSAVAEFGLPLLEFKNTLIAPVSKETALNYWVYMDIFTKASGAVILAALLATAAGVWLAFRRLNARFGLFNGLEVAVYHLLQLAESGISGSGFASRILLLSSGVTTFLLFCHYTADLTARMTSGPPSSSIRSFDDLMRGDGPFLQVVTFPDSAESGHLEFARDGTSMKAYWDTFMAGRKSAFVETTPEAIAHILSTPSTLFFGPHTVAAGDPRLVALDLSDSVRVGAGFTYPQDSEFRSMFDFHLMKLIQSGVVHNVHTKWFVLPPLQIGMQEAVSLGYDNMLFTFIVLAVGIGLAVVALVFEQCGRVKQI